MVQTFFFVRLIKIGYCPTVTTATGAFFRLFLRLGKNDVRVEPYPDKVEKTKK